jgi:iron transport multicopper oxidase
MWSRLFFFLAFVPVFVHSLAATDEIQDADPAQSGYMDNHNMHPATVGSAIFGILWKNTYGAKEKWYAKPLVYTPPGQSQLVFLASSMNIIRTVDAVNGTLLNSRTVQPPFLQSDIGCTDIPDYIGIIVRVSVPRILALGSGRCSSQIIARDLTDHRARQSLIRTQT